MIEGNRENSATNQLLTALAEQLKMPLLQITRLAETDSRQSLPHISVISQQALRLVDAYVQAQSLMQTELVLEPVTTSAVLYDVAQELQPFAAHHEVTIELDQKGSAIPVLAHQATLKTLLTLLAASLIESASELVEPRQASKRLVLGTHRAVKGTVVGAFSENAELTQRALRLTRELRLDTPHAIRALGMSGATALAIADQLSNQLTAPLKAYRHRNLTGVGGLLLPSRQLQLVL